MQKEELTADSSTPAPSAVGEATIGGPKLTTNSIKNNDAASAAES